MAQLALDLQPGDEQLFIGESLEQIERLEQGLLALERGGMEPGTVNEVFRAAHTLKGSAATIRHSRMAALTHVAESVLGALREGHFANLEPFMGALLETVDVLRVLVEEVSAGETRTERAEPLADRLADLLADARGERDARAPGIGVVMPGSNPPGAAAEQELLSALLRANPAGPGAPRAVLRCAADEQSPWKAVRLLQAFLEAEESGALVASEPSRDALEAGVEAARLWLLVALDGADLDRLRGRIGLIDELAVDAVAADHRASPALPTVDRRRVDLGPEARRTTPDERLVLAGERLSLAQHTIRIDVGRLDELMNLVGELVVHKTRLLRQARLVEERLGHDDPLAAETQEGAQQYARIASQLQDQVTRLRMLPIATVFNRFPRVTRDLAVRLGKDVQLVIEGQETELDRSVLEQVGDPLGHLVRNAIDHGIELPDDRRAAGKPPVGRLRLAAWHGEGRITIVVEDDGRGVDPREVRAAAVARGMLSEQAAAALTNEAAIQLIFAPGFSTARAVTDVSGRGVGTDVVRTNIERLGGRVTVHSDLGRGTRFELSLPLTLAIMPALLVRAGGRVCALPLAGVVEIVRVDRSALGSVRGHRVVVLRGRALPVRQLAAVLDDRQAATPPAPEANLVVVQSGPAAFALDVDALLGEQEIVLKSLAELPGSRRGIAGATVLPDGSVALVMDVAALAEVRDFERQPEARWVA